MNNESTWINVHDDELMIKIGIRPRHATSRDLSIWTKTPKEKKILKSLRGGKKMHFGIAYRKSTPIYDRMIIYLKNNKKFPNTTYSIVCGLHQIGDVINHFYEIKNKIPVNVVSKYTFNGKTYSANERPFWY